MKWIAALALTPLVFAGEWKAPGPDDFRAPCPVLNTLANHGFLPHDGKNIDAETAKNAITGALNIAPDLVGKLVDGVFGKINTVNAEGVRVFDLKQLQEHNLIEHDVSLTRSDAALGDWVHFNQTLFDQLTTFSSDGVNLDISALAHASAMRVWQSQNENPNLKWGMTEKFASAIEAVAIYLVLAQDEPGKPVPIASFLEVFKNERLPEGWHKPSKPISTFEALRYAAQFSALRAIN